ncbi:hypothetical protein [Escherichia coli]|uniref:hypothetical protein n=1 Tax=Escherichia coli TaxID=562 RepID=UPI0007FB462D|nr:hypothetical protein [Escherichia coli]
MRPISNLNTSAATYIPPQQLPSSCLETLTLLVQMNNYIKRDADYSTGMAVAPLVPEEVHLLAAAMTTELHRHQFQPVVSANDLQLPEPFTFDVAGFTITFTKTQEHDNTGNLMKIAVSKSGVCTSTNITLELFHSIVTTLMSRSQYGTFDLWSVRPILTDESQNRVHEAARYSPAQQYGREETHFTNNGMREFGNMSPLAWRNDVELQQSCNTSNIPPNAANDDINNPRQTIEDQPEADEPQQYVKLTVDDMRKWAAMDQQARNALQGVSGWCTRNHFNIKNARNYLTDHGLNYAGQVKVNRPHEYAKFTLEHIRQWAALNKHVRKPVGYLEKWCKERNLAPTTARNYLKNDGLTALGELKLTGPQKWVTFTFGDIVQWANMTQEERNSAGGAEKWSKKRGFQWSTARSYLKSSGVTKQGARKLAWLKNSGNMSNPFYLAQPTSRRT